MNKKSGLLLLSSMGIYYKNILNKFLNFVGKLKNKNVAVVVNALEDAETNSYPKSVMNTLLNIGFNQVDFLNLNSDNVKSIHNYDVLYICGGETMRLVKSLRNTNFSKEIRKYIKNGGVCLTASASSIAFGPNIKSAFEIDGEDNDFGEKDFSGFNITNFYIVPHYKKSFEKEISIFEHKYNVKIERLNNRQAIFIAGNKIERI